MQMEFLTDPAAWASFVTLVVLEIVLGVDNLILISILSDKLPVEKRKFARQLGLGIALITRIALLSLIFWIAHLTDPLFAAFGKDISWRDIILIVGGLFLLGKGTTEIHHRIEGEEDAGATPKFSSFPLVIGQIVLMDVVFSFDSVLTAVGVAEHKEVMIGAIIIAVIFMMLAVNWVSDFIGRHPTVKILALSYMLLIGMALIGEGLHFEIPKGYLYFAMAFSFSVEGINMIVRGRDNKKKLKVLPINADTGGT
jgi:predicted tellurium resistance membrane protein TerC